MAVFKSNFSSLGLRISSGLIALALLLSTFYFFSLSGITFLIGLVSFIIFLEFINLDTHLFFKEKPLKAFFIFCFILNSLTLYFFGAKHLALSLTISFITLFWLQKLFSPRLKESLNMLHQFVNLLFAFFYCALLPYIITLILNFDPHGLYFFIFVFTVFAGDTFAYLAGKLWGKKKLYPEISPNKTVAGLIGACLGSGAIGTLFFHQLSPLTPLSYAFGISLITGLVGLHGDLFASLLKRAFGKKDSGQIMPGHGGLLDRFDGILASSPIFYYLISFLPN